MLEKCNSLLVADNILSTIKTLWPETYILTVYIECYQNGREQGYSLIYYTDTSMQSISFSEYRSSEEIVVYHGLHSMRGLSDNAYRNRKFFGFGHTKEAAEYILSLMPKQPTA